MKKGITIALAAAFALLLTAGCLVLPDWAATRYDAANMGAESIEMETPVLLTDNGVVRALSVIKYGEYIYSGDGVELADIFDEALGGLADMFDGLRAAGVTDREIRPAGSELANFNGSQNVIRMETDGSGAPDGIYIQKIISMEGGGEDYWFEAAYDCGCGRMIAFVLRQGTVPFEDELLGGGFYLDSTIGEEVRDYGSTLVGAPGGADPAAAADAFAGFCRDYYGVNARVTACEAIGGSCSAAIELSDETGAAVEYVMQRADLPEGSVLIWSAEDSCEMAGYADLMPNR